MTFIPTFLTHPDAQALCAETDPDAFFPDKGGPVHAAKNTCSRCELIEPCREWAVTHDELGIWGGLTEFERRAIKRETPAPRHRPNNWTDTYTRGVILGLLDDGWQVADVAREFDISARTVQRIRAAHEQETAA